jgi:hypothetical protein
MSDLVERFREGDRDAFAALYRENFPAVFRFALYMTGDRVRAGEITQDVFVWLVRHAGEYDPKRGELAAFLGGVARKFLHRQRIARISPPGWSATRKRRSCAVPSLPCRSGTGRRWCCAICKGIVTIRQPRCWAVRRVR